MKRRRDRWLRALAMVWAVSGPAAARAVPHEILAHGAADRMWVGRFQIVEHTAQGEIEQTDLLVRAAGPGEQWKELATVPSRAQSLVSRDGQAVVLLGDGQWTSVWAPDGASTGQPLPAGADIRALGDDGKTLWAIGAVPGGWSAALAATAHPSTEPASSDAEDAPTTVPTTTPATLPTGPVRDVLFRQTAGVWEPLALVPAAVDNQSGGEIAITVIGSRVLLASASTVERGAIDVTQWTAAAGWTAGLTRSLPANRTAADFQWISPSGSPELWATDGNSPGWLFTDPLKGDAAAPLLWKGPTAPVGLPAIAVAGGYVRLVGLHDGKLYEQRYEPDGRPVGEASELGVPVDVDSSPLQKYVNYGLLAALLLSAGATLYRRSVTPENDPEWVPPPPAPLLPRLGAGVIDFVPVLVTVAVVSIGTDTSRNALDRLQELPAVIATGSAVGFYILHTTVAELLTQRSAGKWLFGLRTVSVDGKRASAVQILLRNGLRVIDLLLLPLVIVLVSPLRQRSADIAAGTMVVLNTVPTGETNPKATSGVSTSEDR